MSDLFIQIIFIAASCLCFTIYNIRAYAYCQSILTPVPRWKIGNWVSLCINYLCFFLVLFCSLPVLITLMIVYFMLVLQFLLFFRDELLTLIFVSGTFMFHIMNIKMIVTSIFVLIYNVPSYAMFQESGIFLSCTFVIILCLLVSLEIFQKTINLQMMQALMKTRSQLQFVTSSMMLINVYQIILSFSYNGQIYSALAGIFLLCTGVLLFGAFYTSFLHAIKMSAMMEFEIKSQRLEKQLQATKENVEELQFFAFIDTLTEVHNRRFGLDELNKHLQTKIPFCLCFLDIDHLKYVNDTYGHEEGDHYILNVVKVISSACLEGETLSRMGGDEFMLLLPLTSYETAMERMQGIVEAVARIPSVYNPSVSYGIVEVSADTKLDASQILQRADYKMYQYKQANKAGSQN